MSLVAPQSGDYLTVAEVAEELRCSVATVKRRIHSGELPAVQLGGPRSPLRVRRDELEEWLTEERYTIVRPGTGWPEPRS